MKLTTAILLALPALAYAQEAPGGLNTFAETDDNPAITGGNPAPAPSESIKPEEHKSEGDTEDGHKDDEKFTSSSSAAATASATSTAEPTSATSTTAGSTTTDIPQDAQDVKDAVNGAINSTTVNPLNGNDTSNGNITDAAWANQVPFGMGLFGIVIAGFVL